MNTRTGFWNPLSRPDSQASSPSDIGGSAMETCAESEGWSGLERLRASGRGSSSNGAGPALPFETSLWRKA
jgi:hypothetical protein